jgi:uncharacterized protein (DUF302 family)
MKSTFTTLLVALVVMTTSASAQSITTLESKFAVKETGDRLAAELDKRGIKVAARIDHAAGAKAAGLDMPPTEVIMFGNPKLGTPLMLAQPSVAIELPMKMLIWQDKAGKVWIGYTPPLALKDRHQIAGQDEPLKTMTGVLDGLAKAASGQ